ncbi:MAG TPA: hypothetical protein VIO11_04310, partial [Candidatus Methanoperedens sp.]
MVFKIWQHARMLKILFYIMIFFLIPVETAIAGTVETGLTTNPCNLRFMDFEKDNNGDTVASTIPGLSFTTTDGVNWVVGDFTTG